MGRKSEKGGEKQVRFAATVHGGDGVDVGRVERSHDDPESTALDGGDPVSNAVGGSATCNPRIVDGGPPVVYNVDEGSARTSATVDAGEGDPRRSVPEGSVKDGNGTADDGGALEGAAPYLTANSNTAPDNDTHVDSQSAVNVPSNRRMRRKRVRPRTKQLRFGIVKEVEKALCMKCSTIQHLFSVSCDGVVSASLKEVISCLGLDTPQYRALSPAALFKMGEITTAFHIEGTSHDDAVLVPRTTFVDVDATTVYLDRLPSNCDVDLLKRRMSEFGTVVNIRAVYPRKRGANSEDESHETLLSSSAASTSSAPSAPVQFAFVQFTSAAAAEKCCEVYRKNMPGRAILNRKKFRVGRKRGPPVHCPVVADGCVLAAKKVLHRKRAHSLTTCVGESLSKKLRCCFEDGTADPLQCSEKAETSAGIDCVPSSTNGAASKEQLVGDGNNCNGVSVVAKSRRNRQHRKRPNKRKLKHKVMHLRRYFRRMQVLPLPAYKILRDKYLELKRSSMEQLKKELKAHGVPVSVSDKGNEKWKLKRGRAKLIARAAKFREEQEALRDKCEGGSQGDSDNTAP